MSNDVTVKNYTLGQNMVLNQELIEAIKQIENRLSDILNIEAGDKNSKESGLNFRDQLKRFLGVFERSDLYFRQLVHQNEYDKVETFCEDRITSYNVCYTKLLRKPSGKTPSRS